MFYHVCLFKMKEQQMEVAPLIKMNAVSHFPCNREVVLNDTS